MYGALGFCLSLKSSIERRLSNNEAFVSYCVTDLCQVNQVTWEVKGCWEVCSSLRCRWHVWIPDGISELEPQGKGTAAQRDTPLGHLALALQPPIPGTRSPDSHDCRARCGGGSLCVFISSTKKDWYGSCGCSSRGATQGRAEIKPSPTLRNHHHDVISGCGGVEAKLNGKARCVLASIRWWGF